MNRRAALGEGYTGGNDGEQEEKCEEGLHDQLGSAIR